MVAHLLFLASVLITLGQFSSVSGLTEAERNLVVQIHNELRQTLTNGTCKNGTGVLPMAANMRQLRYSEKIEKEITQPWVDGCVFKHSRKGYSENLYASTNNNMDASEAIRRATKGWWNEISRGFYEKDNRLMPHNWQPVGHWSPMAWAESEEVACALAHCPSNTIFMCNYNPRGNLMGGKVYKVGKACSACDAGYTCNTVNGMCVKGEASTTTTPSTTKPTTPTTTTPTTTTPTTTTPTTTTPTTTTPTTTTPTTTTSTTTTTTMTTPSTTIPTTTSSSTTTASTMSKSSSPITTTTTTAAPCPYESD